jgi:ketosteroid isomerase-like protein
MKRLVLSLLVALAVAPAAHADDVEDILKLDHENTVATWTADARWFEEHLDDYFLQVTANGTVKNKREVVRDLTGPGFAMDPYEPSEVKVRVFGDTAIVTGRVHQRFLRAGKLFEFDARYTDVYVQRKGRWLLVTAHASSVAKPKVR